MSNNAQQVFPTTAFGDLKTESDTPITQISATYGILENIFTTTDLASSGSNTVVDNKFTCQTGTAADGLAAILTLRLLHYKHGQGAVGKLTAIFSPGAADSNQLAGLITAENSFAFGYVGEDFGIVYVHDGISEYEELTITTPAAGAENATITIAGTPYIVPLTAGNVQHNAWEIANSLTVQSPDYQFTSNNDQVLAQSLLAQPVGAFIFSSATAVAAWVQITAGVAPDIEIIKQADWNVDTRISADPLANLDPFLGNVYQIKYQYLGFGGIKFYVEDNDTGVFVLVHIIKYANTSTLPSVTNPTFRIGWVSRNLGNTTNVTIQGASASGFIEGNVKTSLQPRAVSNDQLAVGTTLTNIITLRNRIDIGGKRNRAEIELALASLAAQSAKPSFFVFVINPTFGGDLDFAYVDKDNSIAEIAKDKVDVIGGLFIGGITVTSSGAPLYKFDDFIIEPGQIVTIAARVSTGAASDMQASITWGEDL